MMTDFSTHTTLLGLQHKLDDGLRAIYSSMQLDPVTERIVTADRSTFTELADGAGDPLAALVRFPLGPEVPALVIVEPALSSAVLTRMWGSARAAGAAMTHVESEIVRQHLADLITVWRGSWRREGIESLPELMLGGPLSMMLPQLVDGPWHIARTVVLDADSESPVGVLLFCFPAPLMPMLGRMLASTRWRSRLARTLTQDEEQTLAHKLHTTLGQLVLGAPVRMSTTMPLHVINGLERGDVIAFDTPVGGSISMNMLDRQVTGGLARTGENLAVCIHDVPGVPVQQHPAAADAGDEHDYQPLGTPHFES